MLSTTDLRSNNDLPWEYHLETFYTYFNEGPKA